VKGLIEKLHNWSLQWANTKWGSCALFICAFADASLLPMPTPMLFLALALLSVGKVYKYAIYGTLGFLFGAIAGYSIGHFAWLNDSGGFTQLAQFFATHIPGFSEQMYNTIHIQYERWDFWILFIASFIPVHFNLFSISAGVFDINFFILCITTLIGQGIKFYLFALLIIKIGPEVKKLFEFKFKLKPIAIIVTVGIAAVIIAIKVF
jgi:membrane protein YqaA with SNARE-associated domain